MFVFGGCSSSCVFFLSCTELYVLEFNYLPAFMLINCLDLEASCHLFAMWKNSGFWNKATFKSNLPSLLFLLKEQNYVKLKNVLGREVAIKMKCARGLRGHVRVSTEHTLVAHA